MESLLVLPMAGVISIAIVVDNRKQISIPKQFKN